MYNLYIPNVYRKHPNRDVHRCVVWESKSCLSQRVGLFVGFLSVLIFIIKFLTSRGGEQSGRLSGSGLLQLLSRILLCAFLWVCWLLWKPEPPPLQGFQWEWRKFRTFSPNSSKSLRTHGWSVRNTLPIIYALWKHGGDCPS